jgi:hypothetical protein
MQELREPSILSNRDIAGSSSGYLEESVVAFQHPCGHDLLENEEKGLWPARAPVAVA